MAQNRFGEPRLRPAPAHGRARGPAIDQRHERQRDRSGITPIISAEEQQKAFRRAERHTRRVRLLKWGLPLIALGIVVGFVSWVAQQKPVAPPAEIAETKKAFQQDQLIMQNPDLNGFSNGSAYQVDAARAIQDVATPDLINLEELSALITDEEDRSVNITARTGRFNQTEEWLELDGMVDVRSSLGYDLQTESVRVEMREGYMQTRSPVEIRSRDVQLRADKLEAINNGEQFRFTGNVKLEIDAALMQGTADPIDQSATTAPNPVKRLQTDKRQ